MIRIAPVLLLALAACTKADDTDDTDPTPVNDGPVLQHTPPTGLTEEVAVPITVTATDEDGVDAIALFYRPDAQTPWDTIYMEGSGETWTAEIPADDVHAPLLQYYFRAQDASDVHAHSYLPAAAQSEPFEVAVGRVGLPLPFVEDFEGSDFAGLYDLGWSEISEGFPGQEWTVSDTTAHEGDASAEHRRGVQGVDPLVDWLISPALDFSGLDAIEVTWWERGDNTELAAHTLWASTTSDDPTDGAWVQVAELSAPPEDAWGKSDVVDLSAYAGEAVVFLAWKYEGQYADGWWIDDVAVQALGPEIDDVGVDFAPAPVAPGGTTTVTLDVENVAPVASAALTVEWLVDPAFGTFTTPTNEDPIAGDAAAEWSSELTVAADFPDNAWLPFTVRATDGVETWEFEHRIIVGEASVGTIAVDLGAPEFLSLELGTGDPDDPDLLVPVHAALSAAGPQEYVVDLTEHRDDLPPAAGDGRWWLAVESGASGTVTAFTIRYDGVDYTSDDLHAFVADGRTVYWLPRPPDPKLASVTPSEADPGEELAVQITLTNEGAATLGATTAELVASHPDVTVVSGGPIEISDTSWAEDAQAVLPFTIRIADDHVDSRPVGLTVVVTDTVESFEVPVEIAVPWPVLLATSVAIDDFSTGDNDGLPDPGETTALEITLSNVGDRDVFGTVTCDLTQVGGTGTATIVQGRDVFGLIAAGGQKTEDDFEITLSAGAVGDSIDMQLVCFDVGETYTTTFGLVVGERPWLALGTSRDPIGDNVGGYEFDFVSGRFRADEFTLELEFTSAVPYDPDTLFIESWMTSPGAPYTYYQLVLQSGNARMRGYDSGAFTTLSTPVITEVDEDTISVAVDLVTMDLNADSLSAGFAAGFCGGDDYYCDHFPDGWGNPYQSGFYPWNFTQFTW